MAIKRGSGIIPHDFYEDDFAAITRERNFIAPFANPLYPNTLNTITDETILNGVPDDGKILLDHIIYGDPMDGVYFQVWTGAGGTGTRLTPTEQMTDVDSTQIRVYRHRAWVDVSPLLSGTQLYFTYKTVESGGEASFAALIYGATRYVLLNNTGLAPGIISGVAGENLENQFVYIAVESGVVKFYASDPTYTTNTSKTARAYVATAVTVGQAAVGYTNGKITLPTGVTVIPGIDYYGGLDGQLTYEGDTGSYALTSSNYWRYVGFGDTASTFVLNTNVPATVRT